MIATCETHGELEFHVDKNHNAWCPKCQSEKFKAYLESDEGFQKISNIVHKHIAAQPPRTFVTVGGERVFAPINEFPTTSMKLAGFKAVTSHKPGTPGFVPPPPRPFGETPGIEPPFATTYIRRVREPEEDEE